MSHSNEVISAPVSFTDVQQVLGISSSVNTLSQLCTHANINIWAKYKPVKLATISTIGQWDSANNKWKDDATWFQGADGAVCGLIPYSTSVFANIISNTNGTMNGWTYQRPTGGASSPYRLTDFALYSHKAVPAIEAFAGTTKTANGKVFAASAAMSVAGEYNVALSDFKTEMYFGVAICNSNGGVVYHGTSSVKSEAYVQFTISGMNEGSYTVYPFLCSEKITPTIGSFAKQYTFWTAPNLNSYQLQITSPSALTGIVATGVWLNTTHTRLSVTVQNTSTGADYTGAIYIRRTGRKWSDAAYRDEPTSESLTFSRNSSVTKTFTGMLSDYNYHAQVGLISGELFEVGIMDDFDPEL